MRKKLTTALIVASILAVGVLTNSCREDLFLPEDIRNTLAAPVIADFEPKTGSIGTNVHITGENLATVMNVYIGAGRAEVVYRYTNYSMVIRLTGYETSGPIRITNNRGTTETSVTFEVIDHIPTNVVVGDNQGNPISELVDEQRIYIAGELLGAVRRITFGDDSIVGRWIDRNDTLIIIEMPFLDVAPTTLATINMEYMAEGRLQVLSKGPYEVNDVAIEPVITNLATIPVETAPNRVIAFRGNYLNRVSEVFLEGHRDSTWTVISQTRTELRVLVPGFIPAVTEGSIMFVHNRLGGDGELKEVMRVRVVNEGALDFVRFFNVRLDVQRPPGEENVGNFLNANDGQVFTACDHEAVNLEEVITFFFDVTNAGDLRFNNPRNSINVFPNFRCGTSLEDNDETQPLAGLIGANATRFRTLSAVDAGDAILIDMARNNEFNSINLAMLSGAAVNSTIHNLGSSSARWSRSDNSAPANDRWEIGDVIVFREFLNVPAPGTNVQGGDGGRFGFVEIVSIDVDGVTITDSFTSVDWGNLGIMGRRRTTVTVNVWFQRVAE